MTAQALPKDDPLSALAQAAPGVPLSTDSAELEFFSTDVYRRGQTPLAVARPESVADLARLVGAAGALRLPIVPRGGGASYSDGYLGPAGAVLIDTSALTGIEIDDQKAIVTVEAGVTWKALRDALEPLGWRTPFWGPFSGIAATVAGSMSQSAISHGSGAYGVSAASATSFEVVLASGEILRTGAAAGGGSKALRYLGPDLTGLFTGDCGALGVKARVTLPLLRQKPAFQAVSFSFPNFAALHAGLRAAAIEGLDDEHFAMDAALSQGQIARQERIGGKADIAASVLKTQGLAGGLTQLAKMGAAGARALRQSEYSAHFILEGVDEAEAKARAKRLRAILSPLGAEIPNTVPTVVRGMPFAPLFNTLGPNGERWVPLHGVFDHDAALAFHVAVDEFYEVRAADMKRLGIWAGGMFEYVTSSGFLYEVAFYWPDARSAYHERVVDADYLAKLPRHPPSAEVAAYVAQLKSDMIALYDSHGAAHFQLGRAYPYAARLSNPALGLIKAIKAELDPHGVMNPGVLGL